MRPVPDQVRVAREARRMGQVELARKCELRQPTISGLETGRHDPKLSTLRRIAKALGITIKIGA